MRLHDPMVFVSDLDVFPQRLIAHGVACVQEPRSVFGARVAPHLDPAGLIISVGEAGKSS